MSNQNTLRSLATSPLSAPLAPCPPQRTKWGWAFAGLAALPLAIAAGCGSETNGSSTTTGGSSSSSSSSGESSSSSSSGSSSSSSGNVVECMPTKNPAAKTEVAMTSAEGIIHDEKGAPVPVDSLVQLCGTNICLNGQTAADGSVKIAGGGQKLTNPAFKYGDGLGLGKFGVPLKDAISMLGTMQTVALPAVGAELAPGKSATSGGVTLTIDAAAGIEHDELVYDTPEKQQFRAAVVPLNLTLPAVDPNLGLTMIFAVGPVDTIVCPPAMVTVDNTAQLAAGTAVEFYAHGVDAKEYYLPYAGWAKVSDGAVSADGKTISTAAGGGLPILTVFGIKPK